MFQRFLWPIVTGVAFASAMAAAWAVSAPVEDWKISGPFGGTATSITIDPKNPKIVLAGARNSLLYQSQNAGATWDALDFPRRPFGEVTAILVDPADSQHYLVAMIATDHPGIFESADGGKTWASTKDVIGVGVRALTASAIDPSHFVAGTLKGVMLSTDSGKTWTRISDPDNQEMQGITAVAFDPKDSNIIYAGTTHLPWRTKDGGKTWEPIHEGMIDDSDVFSIYVDPKTPENIFASACSGIYASSNRGDNWRKLMGIPNTSRRTHVIREDLVEPDTLYAGTTLGLFKTINKGGLWRPVSQDQVNAVALDAAASGVMYFAAEYQGLSKSENRGESITPINQGFVNRRISAVTTSGSNLMAVDPQGGETTGIFTSKDRGDSWQQLPNARGLEGVHMRSIVGLSNEDRILLGASRREIYKSIDNGRVWKLLPIRLQTVTEPKVPVRRAGSTSRAVRPAKPIIRVTEVHASEISSLYSTKNGKKNLIFAATDLGLLVSGDMGEHWTIQEMPGTMAVNALFISPAVDGRMMARTSAGLYFSKDFGDHWKLVYFPKSPSEVNEIAVPGASEEQILVATKAGLYSSRDGGSSWTLQSQGMAASTVDSVVYSPAGASVAYAVEFGQLFRTQDAGSSWKTLSTNLHTPHIRQLWIPDKNSDRVYGITNDIGILFRNDVLIR